MSVERYDIRPDLVSAVSAVPGLNDFLPNYPDTADWPELPIAVFSTAARPKNNVVDGSEIQTEWDIGVDVLVPHDQSPNLMAQQIIDVLTNLGFKNKDTKDANNAAANAVQLAFFGVVDNSTLNVYQK